jgi:uncharacterized protein (DUF1015 family)
MQFNRSKYWLTASRWHGRLKQMCDVRPFCGLRYNPQLAPDPSSIITPPYDVISPEERNLYYRKSPYNIIRLEFGEGQPNDTADNNKYTRAAATLDGWLRDRVLVHEDRPAFYIVEHRFAYQDTIKNRLGLLAGVRLEELNNQGQIRPHEKTTKEPAVDRLNLLRACRANISPIMGLLRSKKGEMVKLLRRLIKREPDLTATDSYGVSYSLWVVTDETATGKISQFFADKVIYIADGHHRYETALRYRDEQRAANPSHSADEPFNFVMMSLMDSQDPGLVMMPTHRLVSGLEPQNIVHLEGALSPYFTADSLLPPLPTRSETIQNWLHTMKAEGKHVTIIGLYGTHEKKLCLLRLKRGAELQKLIAPEELNLWKKLDVFLLQRIVLQEALGLDTLEKEVKHLEYARDAMEAVAQVDAGACQLAFFLNPTQVSSVLDAADTSKRLPQKSTYFYPKTPAGLVVNPL